jgi:hypothetical protein
MHTDNLDSVCGLNCGGCKYLDNGCNGCNAEKGAPFWTGLVGAPVCPVYGCCAEEKKLEHCGLCGEVPCERFTRYRDPEHSDEDVAEGVRSRVAELKRRTIAR